MNIELDDEPQDESEAALFAALPLDFPRPSNLGAVSGAQPKFSMNRYQGRFYSPGCSPPELLERWSNCEDLAQQLSVTSLESKAGLRGIYNFHLCRYHQRPQRPTLARRWAFKDCLLIIGTLASFFKSFDARHELTRPPQFSTAATVQ